MTETQADGAVSRTAVCAKCGRDVIDWCGEWCDYRDHHPTRWVNVCAADGNGHVVTGDEIRRQSND